jgi:hypothetical protein
MGLIREGLRTFVMSGMALDFPLHFTHHDTLHWRTREAFHAYQKSLHVIETNASHILDTKTEYQFLVSSQSSLTLCSSSELEAPKACKTGESG